MSNFIPPTGPDGIDAPQNVRASASSNSLSCGRPDGSDQSATSSAPSPGLTGDDIRKVAELFELLERWSRMPAANDNVELDLSGGSDPSTAK